jgi:hypothetical protein
LLLPGPLLPLPLLPLSLQLRLLQRAGLKVGSSKSAKWHAISPVTQHQVVMLVMLVMLPWAWSLLVLCLLALLPSEPGGGATARLCLCLQLTRQPAS